MLKVDNDGELIHTFSDTGFKIRRNDGEVFEEAYDLKNNEWSYEETNEKVEAVEVEENAEDNTQDEAERLLNILVYGSEGGE